MVATTSTSATPPPSRGSRPRARRSASLLRAARAACAAPPPSRGRSERTAEQARVARAWLLSVARGPPGACAEARSWLAAGCHVTTTRPCAGVLVGAARCGAVRRATGAAAAAFCRRPRSLCVCLARHLYCLIASLCCPQHSQDTAASAGAAAAAAAAALAWGGACLPPPQRRACSRFRCTQRRSMRRR